MIKITIKLLNGIVTLKIDNILIELYKTLRGSRLILI